MDPHLKQLQVIINPFYYFFCGLDRPLVLLERHFLLEGYRQRLFFMRMMVRFFPFFSALTMCGKIDLTVGKFFLRSWRRFFG